ncbi:fatty acid desaturase family protein [Pseudomonas sp. App30]|uniref:fatty acid desaturase family protein n=2 Tax=Gammaproteobacteria TaxID=1236 RepID=UPI003A7F9879
MSDPSAAYARRAPAARRDYRLTGHDAQRAVDLGLASATWYQSPIARKQLKALMQRRNGPALRDTGLWLLALLVTGAAGCWLWGSWACVPFFFAYGVLYGSAANARWHEAGHGTAFRTRWLNDTVYHLASFMILFEPQVWRWSHARHHTDTIIVGRDPEIVEPRPPSFFKMALSLFSLPHVYKTLGAMLRHAGGSLDAEEQTFIPASEWPKVVWTARIWLAILACTLAAALLWHSWLPLMLIGLPTLYGGWLNYVFGVSQHVGLAEDVLDHRYNCRTIYMGPLLRFLYLNMNYHLEHHMFPMVPYHALPQLHEAIRHDCPPPYPNLLAAYREILPTLWRQRRDPSWHVRRPVPAASAERQECPA